MQELENNGAMLAQTELAVKDRQAASAHMHWMIPQKQSLKHNSIHFDLCLTPGEKRMARFGRAECNRS